MDIIEVKKDLQKFNVTNVALEQLKVQCLALTINGIDDKDGYAKVKDARQTVRSKRTEVEKVRKELKEASLARGRMIDEEAKRITGILKPIEDYLEAEQSKIDDEKERIKDEARRKKQEKFDGRNQQLSKLGVTLDYLTLYEMSDGEFASRLALAQTDFDEEQKHLAEIEKEKAAESKRVAKIAAEQEAEGLRLAQLKADIDAREEKIKAEQAAIEAEKMAIEAAKAEEQNEKERLAKLAEQQTLVPQPEAPKESKKFKIKAFNLLGLVQEIACGAQPLEFVQINEVALEKYIAQFNGNIIIPGIIFEEAC